MSKSDHLDNLIIYGGEAEIKNLPGAIPAIEFEQLLSSLGILKLILNQILHVRNGKRSVEIFFVQSSSMSCTVRKVNNNVATLMIPLGVIGRIRVLAGLLLKYWDNSYDISILNSPLDNIPEKNWTVPGKLKPLLGSYLPGEEKQFWQDLQELDRFIDLPELYNNDVSELLHLAVVHLASHEFVHFCQNHFEILKKRLSPKNAKKYGITQVELEKAIELYADHFAGILSMQTLLTQVTLSSTEGDINSYSRGFLRLSYMTTLIFSLYDPRRKYLFSYERDRYTHPLVRRHLTVAACDAALSQSNPALVNAWRANEEYGWNKCMQALNDLNIDCWKGEFGAVDLSKTIFPVHINPGGAAAQRYIQDLINDSIALKNKVSRFISDQMDKF